MVSVFAWLGIVPSGVAEIALMTSGKFLHIERYERRERDVTLFLEGGGEVTVPSDWVANIVPNEIVDRGEVVEEQQLLPQLRSVIGPAASKYDLDPNLVAAVIWTESSGDPNAVSVKGARGLMQLMPETAKELGVTRIMDPGQNVDGGTRYLRQLMDQHNGDLQLALAAYNAGPGAVARYGGIPPYRETQHYVQKVMSLYQGAP